MIWTLVAALAGAVVALVLELRRREAEGRADRAEVELELAVQETARYASALEARRRDYARLVEEIRACPDPAAAADLAERLLDDPWAGNHPALPR